MSGVLHSYGGLSKQKTLSTNWRPSGGPPRRLRGWRCTGCVERLREPVLFSLEKETLKGNSTAVIYCLTERFCRRKAPSQA